MSPPPRRPRFSIGILMVYIALLAVLIASQATEGSKVYNGPFLLVASIELAILLTYRHASRWVWVLVGGMVTYPIVRGVVGLVLGLSIANPGTSSWDFFLLLGLPSLLSQVVFVIGITMILRELSLRPRVTDTPPPAEPVV